MKTMIVKPNSAKAKPVESLAAVRAILDANKISYSYEDDCHITGGPIVLANIESVPVELLTVAMVTDPVFPVGDKWAFGIPGDEANTLCDTEHDARVGFKVYTSWSGEFVNNGVNVR